MARLNKRQLFQIIEHAVRESGWNFLHLSTSGEHPARYQVYSGDRSYRVRVYVWNLTHGGQNRPEDEWRIQVTGVEQFEPEIGGKTLVLGWWDETRVFAGFDVSRHSSEFGASPSIQIREAALHQAVLHGFAPHNKGNGELAIAFRPDFLAPYIENLESLHACGEVDEEVEVLRQIGENPDEVADEDIGNEIARPRQYAVISTKRALREIDFRDRVLTAYSHRCAICGVQLRLLDAAHILPAAHPDSSDGTSNGVALCALHHRAFDRAFVTFGSDYRIHINDEMVEELKAADRAGGLDVFEQALRPILALPPDRKDRPAPAFIDAANDLRGWSLKSGRGR
ncbi:HNH endonuclease [Roseospira navarrensis]|uniref:HNH endonuclease n=1 Tax=Roseospira navarrensis TaxID=140058 RepID=A0A7X1ZFL2_9PROT|nr:HNH endonuclease [Roseospira navarrensis]MQX37616.1 HNH endonuclease [Roseospira navarrensis]